MSQTSMLILDFAEYSASAAGMRGGRVITVSPEETFAAFTCQGIEVVTFGHISTHTAGFGLLIFFRRLFVLILFIPVILFSLPCELLAGSLRFICLLLAHPHLKGSLDDFSTTGFVPNYFKCSSDSEEVSGFVGKVDNCNHKQHREINFQLQFQVSVLLYCVNIAEDTWSAVLSCETLLPLTGIKKKKTL